MAEFEDPTPGDGGHEHGYQRESPAVYRRRRIIALILALLVIVLIVWGVVFAVGKIAASISGMGGGASTSAPPTDNFASFSARPSPSGSGSGGPSGSIGPSASSTSSASGSPSESPSDSPSDAEAEGASPSRSTAEDVSATRSEGPKPQECGSNIQVSASLDKKAYSQGENPVMTANVKNTGGDPCTVDLGASKVTYEITSGPADVYSNAKCGGAGGAKEATLPAGGTQTLTQPWDRTINVYGCGDSSQPAQPGYYWLTVSVNGVPSERQPIVLQ